MCALLPAPQPAAAANGLPLHQYNIKSASRPDLSSLLNARQYLLFAVNANNSWYVVVNEMCADDYRYFATNFRAGPSRQYDDIWSRNPGSPHWPVSAFCPSDASDHCLVEADQG